MSGTFPSDRVAEEATVTMTLAAEEASVSKRVRQTLVRAFRTTSTRNKSVAVDLAQEQVVVDRVAIGRVVDAVPPVRQNGDVTIIPVVEEEVVVVRRLVLTEEVHLRRVRTVTPHVQSVELRRHDLTVTRSPLDDEAPTPPRDLEISKNNEGFIMNDETIVAVYDTAVQAENAVAALKGAGVPSDAISMHAGTMHGGNLNAGTAATTERPVREQGFWAGLFGGTPDYDTAVYDRSLEAGSVVVSVKAPEKHVTRVTEILESQDPIDIEDRAASFGLTHAAAPRQPLATSAPAPTTPAQSTLSTTGRPRDREETIQLAEETLAVGKRVVNRGGTRIRRHVVETPVEERVTLHDERVVMDRRPVTDGRTVDADFSDKTIEMTETAEEPVVSKTARVVEEIGLRKEVSDRVETVRDTVRKDEVEVVQVPGAGRTTDELEPATTSRGGNKPVRPKV